MLIKNYGLFWQRKRVHFGKGRNAGALKGVKLGSKKGEPVDFREQQGVYCLYDNNFRLVYIGQAGGKNSQRLFTRLRQHRDDAISDRWTQFSWFGILSASAPELRNGEMKTEIPNEGKSSEPLTPFKIGDVLNHIEAILIAATEPPLNKQSGRFGNEVEQYLQFRDDENIHPEDSDMLHDLWKKDQKKENGKEKQSSKEIKSGNRSPRKQKSKKSEE